MKRKGMTPARLAQAVGLCWEGRATEAEIANRLRIGRRTLSRWKQKPEFKAQYRETVEKYHAGQHEKMLAEVAVMFPRQNETAQNVTKCYTEQPPVDVSLPKISPMQGLPGSLHEQYVRCGKAGCRCGRGELHGPYLYRFGWDYRAGRVWKEYVRKAEVERTRRLVEAYRLGQRLQRHFNRVGWHHSTPELVRWMLGRRGQGTD